MSSNAFSYDAIVAASGIGGFTCAAALSQCGCRVLLLECPAPGDELSQSWVRNGYACAGSICSPGGLGGQPGLDARVVRLIRSISADQVRFEEVRSTYDVIRLPGLDIRVGAPRINFIDQLKASFSMRIAEIDDYFAACDRARDACIALSDTRAGPSITGSPLGWLRRRRARRAIRSFTSLVLERIQDRRLVAALTARWGDYGMIPARSPVGAHALVSANYASGMFYPSGGTKTLKDALGLVVAGAGGRRLRCPEDPRVIVGARQATGVRLSSHECFEASVVVSDLGSRRTGALLDEPLASAWMREVGVRDGPASLVCLYLMLRGAIAAHGASPANFWIYESDDVSRLWQDPLDEPAPQFLVSFPSLKDPALSAADHHIAEILAWCRWDPLAEWAELAPEDRPRDFDRAKARVTNKLLEQFRRHFPELDPLIESAELVSPSVLDYPVDIPGGAMRGLETSKKSVAFEGLQVTTPVRGLLLAGQHVTGPGIQGACLGGFFAAAEVERRLWRTYAN